MHDMDREQLFLIVEQYNLWIASDRCWAKLIMENPGLSPSRFGGGNRRLIAVALRSRIIDRLVQNTPMNDAPTESHYGGGAEGYTDYPILPKAG